MSSTANLAEDVKALELFAGLSKNKQVELLDMLHQGCNDVQPTLDEFMTVIVKNHRSPDVQYGHLAELYCQVKVELQVMDSNAGFYLGTWTKDLGSISRESEEYFKTHDAATAALGSGEWTQRVTP